MKERALEVANQLEQDIARTVWDEDRIRNEFGLRSIDEIEESREIHFLCCMERNFAFAYRAALADIPTKLVMSRIQRTLQPIKIGTSVELVTPEEEPLTFVAANSGNTFMEKRNPTKSSHTHTHKVDYDPSRTDISWFEHFGVQTPEQLQELIPGFQFEALLTKIVRHGTRRKLEKVQARIAQRKAA
jgi:hypothetical protein